MTPMAMGVPIGLLAAWWLAQYLAAQLYSTSTHEPVAFGSVVALLLAAASIAAFVPARRATRINPVETLRAE
jgi:putative ABC transport system permease protein